MTTEAETYEIQVRGHLDHHWATWLGAADLHHNSDGTTSIRTAPIDQSQLHGLLAQLRDIGAAVTMLKATDVPEEGRSTAALAQPLTTQRLTLRSATPDDADATWRYRRLPDVAEWLTELPTDQDSYRQSFADPERLAATVIVEHDRTIVGDFMLRVEDAWAQAEVRNQAHALQAEVGWTLDPEHTGRGYATEAAGALIDHCFTTLGVRRVVANCFADNTASVRLIERLGMRREEHAIRESLHRSGHWLDTSRYALLADEWPTCDSPRTVPTPRASS
jgi:RimJ/RimL family protein N-acetyltransferase